MWSFQCRDAARGRRVKGIFMFEVGQAGFVKELAAFLEAHYCHFALFQHQKENVLCTFLTDKAIPRVCCYLWIHSNAAL